MHTLMAHKFIVKMKRLRSEVATISVNMNHHPFIAHPHRALLGLSLPVLLSLIAEPLTGLVDTGFVAALGTAPLAALGVGTMILSSIFWAFNFLGIGSQTEVAQAMGSGDVDRVRQTASLALLLSLVFGLMLDRRCLAPGPSVDPVDGCRSARAKIGCGLFEGASVRRTGGAGHCGGIRNLSRPPEYAHPTDHHHRGQSA